MNVQQAAEAANITSYQMQSRRSGPTRPSLVVW